MPHTATPWQALYTPTPVRAWVAEAPTAWHRTIPEKLVRCLWFDQRWRPSPLHTLDGRELLVHSPGRWNLQAGPDFHQASIEFVGGERHRGDVEIHCYASGWTAHRHHLDARYNSVILHVFLWHDRPAVMAQRADGLLLPQVALAPHLSRPLAAYQADIILEDYPYKTGHAYGQCYETLQRLTPPEVSDILNRAGDTRLQQRVWRWSHRETEVGLAQAMYEAVLRALGSTGHRQHFQALARLASWPNLQRCLHGIPAHDRGIAAEALLLGLAGIVPATIPTGDAVDAETGQYVRSLQEYWHAFPADLRERAWHDVDWHQPHVRPANTPQRRLAGMAQMLAHYHGTSLLDAAVTLCRTHSGGTDTQTARALCHASYVSWTCRRYRTGRDAPTWLAISARGNASSECSAPARW